MSRVGGTVEIQKTPFGWYAKVGGQSAGVLKMLTQEGETFVIGDMEVYSEFRRRGVGSQLLAALLEEAKEKQVRQITGKVTEHDNSQPFLKAWYESYGFQISPLKEDSEQAHFIYEVVWTNPNIV